MNLSNYTTKRSRFFSPLESIGELDIVGPDINENVTLKIKDIKSFISYCSMTLTREPLVIDTIDLMTISSKTPSENIDFNAFVETTKLNNKLSFYFQATTFANKVSLRFSDRGLIGVSNTYKPFDSSDSKTVDSMISASLDEIRQFSDKYFKFKNFRGIAVFDRAYIHGKGYTIYLSDKDLYLTIIGARYNNKSSITSYTAVLYTGV